MLDKCCKSNINSVISWYLCAAYDWYHFLWYCYDGIVIRVIRINVMAGNFQDDDREHEMRELFGLYKDENEGRSGIDAYLDLDGRMIPFELKTTSNGSVTTVRDFGPDHIEKWKNKHWLIGFFVEDRIYYKYGSPSMMASWIKEKEKYIKPDFQLANMVSGKLDIDDMFQICEEKAVYTFEDARGLQKKQYKKEKYMALQDVDNGYTPARMLDILQDRAKYLINRGSTLNNPHIPLSYFKGWIEITEDHATQLREMVKGYFNKIE